MAGGYRTWPLIQFNVIGEAWQLYKRHWFVWSLATLIALTADTRSLPAASWLFSTYAE